MNCLHTLIRCRCIPAAGGLLILFAASISPPAHAEEQMMRHDGGNRGGTTRDIGTGLAIGGIIINQLNQPGENTEKRKVSKKSKKVQKEAKKPQQVNPDNGKTPGEAIPPTSPASPSGDLPKTTGKDNPNPP